MSALGRRWSKAAAWVQAVPADAKCGEADFPFGLNTGGYGQFSDGPTQRLAHRAVLERFAGPPPVGKPFALHGCDRPICCAPSCLRWGSDADNKADMVQRDRGVQGERHHAARLTEDDVRQIHAFVTLIGLPQKEVAAKFGVYQSHVSDIVNGRRWSHLGLTA